MTDPLVPAEVELHDFQFMPLDVRRLRDSRLVATKTPEEVVAAILLWSSSWHQSPAASLPDDDVELSALSGYGGIRGVALFRKIKDGALYGFVRCSDGRWYHPVVAEKALAAWRSKVKTAHSKDKDRYRKQHNTTDGFPTAEAWNADRLSAGRGLDFRWNAASIPEERSIDSAGDECFCEVDSSGNPPETTPKGEGEGEGEGYVLQNPLSESPAEPSITDCPQRELLALYAKHLHMLRQPRVWDGQRADLMRTRWRYCAKANGVSTGYATKEDGLTFWEDFFAYVASCKKLTEGIPYKDGTGTIWRPDLPWLLKAENFAKVVEGTYA